MRSVFLAGLLASALGFGTATVAQQAEVTDEALLASLKDHSNRWSEAFNSNSAEMLAALYTEDAVEVTNQGPIYGRDAIKAHYEVLLENFQFSDHAGEHHKSYHLSEGGDMVLSHGMYNFTFSDGNGNSMPLTGYWSSVTVMEDGVWRDKMQTWNVAQTPAEAESPDTLATQN